MTGHHSGNLLQMYINGQAESGSFAAALGSVGSDGTLSQTLQTTAGQQYTLSFWLANNDSGPDDFTAKWNGTTVLALTNAPAQGYTEYTFTVTATGSTSTLEFDARQDPSHWSLDNISVIPVGAETSLNGFVSVSDTPNIDDTLTTTLTVLYGKITVAAPGGATCRRRRQQLGDADRDGGGDQRGAGDSELYPHPRLWLRQPDRDDDGPQ